VSPQYQQNIVSLYNAFTSNLAPTQPQAGSTTPHGSGDTITGGSGACVAASYWEIGVRGDTGPSNHTGGTYPGLTVTSLAPTYSVLSDPADYPNGHNVTTGNPSFVSQYCDGSRTPPEYGQSGWQVPPGIADATVPNPIFNLMPVATVDEGNNWVNLRWGPLSMVNPVTNNILGNYSITAGSSAYNVGNNEIPVDPTTAFDIFGTPRQPGSIDIGAVEILRRSGGPAGTLSFTAATNATLATVAGVRTLTFTIPSPRAPVTSTVTITNTGNGSLQITADFINSSLFSVTGTTCSFTTPLAPNGTCTISVRYATPATAPGSPNRGTLSVNNNGTATTGGASALALVGQ
jgi:hypothetical protein